MVFILQFVNMLYHIDWFAYIEESFHFWDKPHLIMVYDPFNVLFGSVCPDFLVDFCMMIQSLELLTFSWSFEQWH